MTIKLELDLQVAKALQGLVSVINKQDDVDKSFTKSVKTARQLGDEYARFAKEVQKLNSTPAEQLQQRQHKLNETFKAGKIDVALYHKEIARMRAELQPAAAEGDGLVKTMMAGGGAAMVWQRVSEAVQKVRERVGEVRAELKGLLDENKSQADVDREFLAVSGGGSATEDAAEVSRRILMANKMAARTGLSISEAKNVILESQNYGLSDQDTEDVGKFARLTGSAGDAAKLAGMTKSAFSQENLTAAQTNAMVLGAARVGPATPKTMAQFLPPSMVSAGALGMQAVDVASAYSVASSKLGSEKGADRLSMFISRLGDPESGDTFKGKTIMQSAAMLKADQGLKEKILGNRIEAGQALAALTAPDSMGIYNKARQSAEMEMARAGTAADPTDQKLAAMRLIPSLRAADIVSKSETAKQLAGQRLVPREAEMEASTNLAEAALRQNPNINGLIRGGAVKFMNQVRDWTGFDGGGLSPQMVGLAGTFAGPARGAGADPFAAGGTVSAVAGQKSASMQSSVDYLQRQEELIKDNNSILSQIRDLLGGRNHTVNRARAQVHAAKKPQ